MSNKNRIESLDWLRGLMALSIMFYHLFGWIFFSLDSGSVLGRLGIYGVSIFFILSGLSMAIVYNKNIVDIKSFISFLIRRIFRIWPLFWIACLLIILLVKATGGINFSKEVILLNFTTLFGFIKPEANIPTGSWSIGNEMVYYFLTPIIFFIYNKKLALGNIFFVFTILISMVFSYFLLSPDISLSNQWVVYINPLNSLYLYVCGIAIYYNFKEINVNQKFNVLMLFTCGVLFIFLPFAGDHIKIVTGIGRISFSFISFCLVFSVYKLEVKLPKAIKYLLETLGIITYSIYLLHPIVYSYSAIFLRHVLKIQNQLIVFAAITLVTVMLSIISYIYFEKPIMNIGKKITKDKRLISNKAVSKI